MKVGDKLLCKNDYFGMETGKYYNVIFFNKKMNIKVGKCLFLLNKNEENEDYYYVWDYFCTPQEERKLKLKQLNKC